MKYLVYNGSMEAWINANVQSGAIKHIGLAENSLYATRYYRDIAEMVAVFIEGSILIPESLINNY